MFGDFDWLLNASLGLSAIADSCFCLQRCCQKACKVCLRLRRFFIATCPWRIYHGLCQTVFQLLWQSSLSLSHLLYTEAPIKLTSSEQISQRWQDPLWSVFNAEARLKIRPYFTSYSPAPRRGIKRGGA